MLVRLFALCFLLLLSASRLHAGAGVTMVAIFDPRAGSGITTPTAEQIADRFHDLLEKRMQEYEIWGIDLLTREATTATALRHLHTRSPKWKRQYPPSWVSFLNTNEMITYGAFGSAASSAKGKIHVRYELWDFALNRRIGEVEASGTSVPQIAQSLAQKTLVVLQVYFSEIFTAKDDQAVVSLGPESVSTGTLLVAYEHRGGGPHLAKTPAHGHKDEEDHFYGSKVYKRFRNTHGIEGGYVPCRCDGRLTGVLRVEGFVQPKSYYELRHAVTRVVWGHAVPGGFVRLDARYRER